MTKYFKLKEVPKKDVKDGLIALVADNEGNYKGICCSDIKKGQIKYLLPEEFNVVGIYQQIKMFK